MADRFVAASAGPVLALLAERFPEWHKNTLRERVRLGCVEVNGAAVLRHDHPVAAGDEVTILAKADATPDRRRASALPVLFEDEDLIAIDKPAGLLSVASDDERTRTALAVVREQVGRGGPRGALWPAHRLDRETSGVLLFAKSREVLDAVQAAWPDVRKVYAAVVEGVPEPPVGEVDLPLREDRGLFVRAGRHPDAKPARTRYRTLEAGRGRTLLEVELDTGRKHQIRVHLATIGHPVVGDDRYGARAPRLCLHAARLELRHPKTGLPIVIEAPMPAAMRTALAAR